MITLTNDFHGTSCRVNTEVVLVLSPTQRKRAWRKLCGMRECSCSDGTGTRGIQLQPNGMIIHLNGIGLFDGTDEEAYLVSRADLPPKEDTDAR